MCIRDRSLNNLISDFISFIFFVLSSILFSSPSILLSSLFVLSSILLSNLFNISKISFSIFTPHYFEYLITVSYTHLRAHETSLHLVCRLLLEKKNTQNHAAYLYILLTLYKTTSSINI
eukprot:TRINITY_DN33660_c0_g1_i1.p2 TRINITY_DN33660_c0_g1~~TRINITY_DN33660_c0_g1_i1.p2  ORF type:complete len:119 (+),score=2.06 TRINITY_DN33660_c0_g1_i1:148-504(+)